VTIHQDVDLYAALLTRGQRISHSVVAPRQIWLQVARGDVAIAGQRLGTGDGVAISEPGTLSLEALANAEILLFDMADANQG